MCDPPSSGAQGPVRTVRGRPGVALGSREGQVSALSLGDTWTRLTAATPASSPKLPGGVCTGLGQGQKGSCPLPTPILGNTQHPPGNQELSRRPESSRPGSCSQPAGPRQLSTLLLDSRRSSGQLPISLPTSSPVRTSSASSHLPRPPSPRGPVTPGPDHPRPRHPGPPSPRVPVTRPNSSCST